MASEPFLKMLRLWLFKGELQDPYQEFMIQENKSVSREGTTTIGSSNLLLNSPCPLFTSAAALAEDFNAQYWDERYILRPQHVPKILKGHSNSLAQMILTAGKYLNVVRGCYKGDKELQLPQVEVS